jgi:hypothetical protein
VGRTGHASRKMPWDQRIIERLARQSWEAANDPSRRQNPPFHQQIKSRYYWLSVVAFGGGAVIFGSANAGWLYGLAGALYIVGLLATVAARRDARAPGLRRERTEEG